MNGSGGSEERAVAPVIGTILLVGVAVIIGATVTVLALGLTETGNADAPTISVSYELVDDGSDRTIAVTHVGGDNVDAERLFVTGSKDIDIGGPPSASGNNAAADQFASERERFNEGNDQVDVGDEWESGETVHIDPVNDVDGVTIRFAWSEQPVQNVNPGEPRGADSFVVAKFTVGER